MNFQTNPRPANELLSFPGAASSRSLGDISRKGAKTQSKQRFPNFAAWHRGERNPIQHRRVAYAAQIFRHNSSNLSYQIRTVGAAYPEKPLSSSAVF
jgi:hypothetical protein